MDASLRSLAQFDDPSRWVVVPNVPVFDTFEMDVPARQLPNGTSQPASKVRFDVEHLHALCQKANHREATTGDVCPLALGHTIPGAPETMQPPVVGYARNFRVAPFGPAQMPAATCDFWYMREHWGQGYKADEYKRKSVELWFKGQMFDPIALLKSRTPMRDLGLIMAQRGLAPVYQSDHAALYPVAGDFKLCYSMESFLMDPTTPPDANAPDNDFLEKMMKCMKHPHFLHALHAAMGGAPPPGGAPPAPAPAMPYPAPAPMPTPQAGGMPPHAGAPPMPPHAAPHMAYPGPTSGGLPGQHEPQRHQMPWAYPPPYPAAPAPHAQSAADPAYQLPPDVLMRLNMEHMANLQAQMAQQQQEMGQIRQGAKLARAEKAVNNLWHQGYDFHEPSMVQRFMQVDEQFWPGEVEHVQKHYRVRPNNEPMTFENDGRPYYGAPVGGSLVPGLDRAPDDPARANRPPTAQEDERAQQFIRQHPEWEPGQAYDLAMQMVRGSPNGAAK